MRASLLYMFESENDGWAISWKALNFDRQMVATELNWGRLSDVIIFKGSSIIRYSD